MENQKKKRGRPPKHKTTETTGMTYEGAINYALDKEVRTELNKSLADKNADISGHDTILLGFPIWWYVAPTIINTFLESYDFSGKKIVLFATSGGSGFGKTVDGLKGSVSADTQIIEGKLLNSKLSEAELKKWVESL